MDSKQRHGCVTAWLILMIITNSITSISYIFMGDAIKQNLNGQISQTTLLILSILGIANLIFAIMLFQWKKWAFYAFAVTSLITLVLNLSNGLGFGPSLFGLSGVVILYAILQIKQDGVTAWENLE